MTTHKTKEEIIKGLYDTHYHYAMQGNVESSKFLLDLIEKYPHIVLRETGDDAEMSSPKMNEC